MGSLKYYILAAAAAKTTATTIGLIIIIIKRLSSYRAVNALRLSYKSQSVNAV